MERSVTAKRGRFLNTLSGRFLILTVAFVMLAEILIFVPSIARYRADYLLLRLEKAQIASLALLAAVIDQHDDGRAQQEPEDPACRGAQNALGPADEKPPLRPLAFDAARAMQMAHGDQRRDILLALASPWRRDRAVLEQVAIFARKPSVPVQEEMR